MDCCTDIMLGVLSCSCNNLPRCDCQCEYCLNTSLACNVQDSSVDRGSLGESASEATPSGADMQRVSSSSEGSLAALFYPPLPHERSGQAGMAATPKGQIRRTGSSRAPFSAGAAHGESMLGHHPPCHLDT